MGHRVFAALLVLLGVWASSARAAEPVLEKAVVLMRHGVRPPTDTPEISRFAARPWPEWGVADGELTPHGRLAAEQLGRWERRMWAARGLLPADGCPAPGDVFAWANSDRRRTVDTANAMLDSMFPGCGLVAGHLAISTPDPLFMASESALGRMDHATARAAILEKMGGSFDRPRQELAGLLAELQSVLGCCTRPVCEAALKQDACTLTDLPWALEPAYHGNTIAPRGPMNTGSTIAQVLLLQYAEGLPPERLGWGKVPTAADVIRLSAIRKIKYEYYERVPYIARRGASNIARQIVLALEAGAGIVAADAAEGPPPAKLVLFVGSDTQIAEIGALLDAHWQVRSYLDDETPPDGGLVFEVLRDPDSGRRLVRLSFLAQTLDQLRSAAPLDQANPPEFVPIAVPGCSTDGAACEAGAFTALLRSRIDPTAVGPPPYRRPQ